MNRLAKGKNYFFERYSNANIKREVDKRGFVSYRKADEYTISVIFLDFTTDNHGISAGFCYQLAWEYDWRMREEVYNF